MRVKMKRYVKIKLYEKTSQHNKGNTSNLLSKALNVRTAFPNYWASILRKIKKINLCYEYALHTELRVSTRSISSPRRGRGILFGGGFPNDDVSPQSPRSRFLPKERINKTKHACSITIRSSARSTTRSSVHLALITWLKQSGCTWNSWVGPVGNFLVVYQCLLFFWFLF